MSAYEIAGILNKFIKKLSWFNCLNAKVSFGCQRKGALSMSCLIEWQSEPRPASKSVT